MIIASDVKLFKDGKEVPTGPLSLFDSDCLASPMYWRRAKSSIRESVHGVYDYMETVELLLIRRRFLTGIRDLRMVWADKEWINSFLKGLDGRG